MPDDDVVEVPPAPTAARRRRGLAVGAVLVVLAAGAGVGTWAATRDSGSSSAGAAGGASACPGQVTIPDVGTPASAVPAPPGASGTSGRLVPDRDPGSVVLCEYPATVAVPAASEQPGSYDRNFPGGVVPEAATGPVAVGRTATPDVTDPAVATLLTRLREATPSSGAVTCASFAGAASVDLVGLKYDDGTVWVAAAGPCAASNGDVTVDLDVTTLVTTALDGDASGSSGTTVAPATPSPGGGVPGSGSTGGGSTGGPGSGPTILPGPDNPFETCAASTSPSTTALVPFTPVGVRVCHVAVDPSANAPTAVDRPADVAAGLASALAGLPTLEPDVVCTAIGGEQWGLLFTAADGTTAAVQVDAGGCGSATNGVQTVKTDAALYDLLRAAQ